jgi:DNA polymerase (family X)
MNTLPFSDLLEEMAFLAELKGENPFKVRAWLRAAELLDEKDVASLYRAGGLEGIPGIGKGILSLIGEYAKGGELAEHKQLRAAFPSGILELWGVRGLGPKKVKALYESLGISSVAELEYACEENRLLSLKGFGEKTQNSILKEIRAKKAYSGRVLLPKALAIAEEEMEDLRSQFPGATFALVGELRRLMETCDRIEILGMNFDIDGLSGFAAKGQDVWVKQGEVLPVFLTKSRMERWGTDLWMLTRGDWALRGINDPVPALASEEEVALFFGKLPLVPEARDLGLWPKSERGSPLNEGIQTSHIRGGFHLHTTASDGKDSLRDMAKKAVELGWEYLGLSDHSGSSFYANGLNKERLLAQKREIEEVQKEFPTLRIFHGVESDILADGALDYPDSILEQLDFVIASIHGQMSMNKEKMTARLVKALSHPMTTWLGHPTGRLLLGRTGYEFDWSEIIHVAKEEGKSFELNANPYRLDVDWRILPQIAEAGVPIAISPDAHSKEGLADVRYGVAMARKAGLSVGQVVNTKSRAEMESWLKR